MIGAVTNHLWQSTLFGLAAALLAVACRRNQARIRYALWFSASVKFVLPFTLLMSLGNRLAWTPPAQAVAVPAVALTMVQVAQPFPQNWPLAGVSSAPSQPGRPDWRLALLGLWMGGFGVIACIRVRLWRGVRVAVRASTPLTMSCIGMLVPVEVRATPGLLEPGVVGFVRPILLMPADLQTRLTPQQLNSVVAHEMCHVRRRDNVTAAIHMLVEAVFWFYPVVWWIGARLVDERERACDEEVLRMFGAPQIYAEGILAVCKRYVDMPLACVSGVGGSNLRRRIEAIMTNRIGRRLNFTEKTGLILAALGALLLPILLGSLNVSAQSVEARCDGDPAIVRVTQIKPTSSYQAFMKAQEAQIAWYRKNGFTDLQVYSSRVMVNDPITQVMRPTDTVIAFHVHPPDAGQSVASKDQAGWDAYVKQYRDSSTITAQYTVCLPKNR